MLYGLKEFGKGDIILKYKNAKDEIEIQIWRK